MLDKCSTCSLRTKCPYYMRVRDCNFYIPDEFLLERIKRGKERK